MLQFLIFGVFTLLGQIQGAFPHGISVLFLDPLEMDLPHFASPNLYNFFTLHLKLQFWTLYTLNSQVCPI